MFSPGTLVELHKLWRGLYRPASLEKKVVAVVLEPVAGRIEDLEARAKRLGLEADPETVEEVREGFAETWRVVEERGV